MLFAKCSPFGLRFHALLVSACLLVLMTLLGLRAYTVARLHLVELESLASHDMKAEASLIRMEAAAASRDQAWRKQRITHDSVYAALTTHYEEGLKENGRALADSLSRSYPDLAPRASGLETVSEIQQFRDELQDRRAAKLDHAHQAALGLLRNILGAFMLTLGLTAWLLHLFFRGLLRPLGRLRAATDRVRSGDLAHRIDAEQGVSELRALSASFNTMSAKLESLDQAKTEFLATVSHEIKNPLAALKEGLSLLSTREDSLSPQSRSKAFAACLIAAKRLETMINNVLHHSQEARSANGLYRFTHSRRDIVPAIQTAIDEVRPLAEKKGMSIQLSGPGEILASFNWDGMVQVVVNLLHNAIKYGTENTVVSVRATQTRKPVMPAGASASESPPSDVPHVDISVENLGPVIPAADLPRLFDRFYRGANTGKQQGLGLGLHVVRRIVDAHHGKVAAESAAGRTRIELSIPGAYETELRPQEEVMNA